MLAHIVYETLAWRDADGNPINDVVGVPYDTIVKQANVSRGAARKAFDELLRLRCIQCLQAPQPARMKQPAQIGMYTLAWDDDMAPYTTCLERFNGFFAGEGNKSPIPSSFFTYVIPNHSRAEILVTGDVLRHTVGYEHQFGRRQQAPLSITDICRHTGISRRATISDTLRSCVAKNLIVRVAEPVYTHLLVDQKAAVYAVKWCKLVVEECASSKSETGTRFKKRNSSSSLSRFRNRNRSGSKNVAAHQSKNRNTKKENTKETNKQQVERPAVAADSSEAVQMLLAAGFDENIARVLSQQRTVDEIEQQIEWLPQRNASKNPLGLLRRAIEEGWTKPAGANPRPPMAPVSVTTNSDTVDEARQERLTRRQGLFQRWQTLSGDHQQQLLHQAVEKATSELVRSRLGRCRDLAANPPREVLQLIAQDLPTSTVEAASPFSISS